MKLNALAFSAAAFAASVLLTSPSAYAQSTCLNDIDCVEGGTACGTNVCEYGNNEPMCTPPSTGATGWCTTNSDCKCADAGAICMGVTCSNPADGGLFVAPPGSLTSVAGSSTSTTSTGNTSESTTTKSSSKSGGCDVGFGSFPASPGALAGLALAGCLAAARRRKRS